MACALTTAAYGISIAAHEDQIFQCRRSNQEVRDSVNSCEFEGAKLCFYGIPYLDEDEWLDETDHYPIPWLELEELVLNGPNEEQIALAKEVNKGDEACLLITRV
ncbi:MAG: hypothetical protein HRU25_18060 [Psychrobium sp.]|nr:hypothetical protein [Psychrobium sp.]